MSPKCVICEARRAVPRTGPYCWLCYVRFVVDCDVLLAPSPDNPFMIERERRIQRMTCRAEQRLPLLEDVSDSAGAYAESVYIPARSASDGSYGSEPFARSPDWH